ncbi:hypothetical protein [Polaromonas sp.]|uniref:hypothetical protein n=1 Tax=Polaromonas sp. TaxID=1869339 RepID=UPI003C8B3EB5
MSTRACLAFMLALCLGAAAQAAPADATAADKLAQLQAISAQVKGQVPAQTAPAREPLSEEGRKDVEAAMIANVKGSAAHEQWKRGFIQSSWMWHLWSTGLLFFLVMLIVCFGLYMTYVQFNRDYSAWAPPPQDGSKPVPPATPGEAPRAPAPTLNSVKINAGGLELTSQVIGLLVLAFSLAFFYFYVQRVYPMQTEELTQLKDRDIQEDKAGKKGGEQAEPATGR